MIQTILTIISLIFTMGSITLLVLSLFKAWKYINTMLDESRKSREERLNKELDNIR